MLMPVYRMKNQPHSRLARTRKAHRSNQVRISSSRLLPNPSPLGTNTCQSCFQRSSEACQHTRIPASVSKHQTTYPHNHTRNTLIFTIDQVAIVSSFDAPKNQSDKNDAIQHQP
jgi:hypothetical protein